MSVVSIFDDPLNSTNSPVLSPVLQNMFEKVNPRKTNMALENHNKHRDTSSFMVCFLLSCYDFRGVLSKDLTIETSWPSRGRTYC